MPFHPWIRKLSVNVCLNFKRTIKSNIISLNAETFENSSLEDSIASSFNLEKEVENLDFKKILKEHLKNLPENYRLVIILRYYEDLSYNEISELIEKPLGTVKTELYRAKAMLKKRLENILGE
jgi:RNA polymerase sigma-70 factor (ECF subfamily)